jgi:hypothetical protein
MRPASFLTLLASACFLAVPVGPAAAGTLVLDGDDVSDWVRVLESSAWKYRDACLIPNALLKFDLGWNVPVTEIVDARLELFVEKAGPGSTIDLWHVSDDGWSYGGWQIDTLRTWPVWHSIGTFAFDDTAAISADVTAHLREELHAGESEFSIKITSSLTFPDIRIASPLAPIQRMRPRIVVEFTGPSAPPPLPDLAVSTADIRFTPMRPTPGQAVTVQAWVRNLGSAAASNVTVAFWDGAPGAGSPIGSVIVPHLDPGGAAALAAVSWPAVRGLREIHVVVDPDDSTAETDESNNADFRAYLVGDPGPAPDRTVVTESFEYPGLSSWHSDFEVPKQYPGMAPKGFYVNRSGAEAYHGHHAMEMFLDGTADDGTIWLETAIPAEPNSFVDVNLDFELFRYVADIAFLPVAAVSVLDPEREVDFTVLPAPSQEGWSLHSYRKTVFTGPYEMVHVAAGVTVTWETPGTLFMDLVRIEATHRSVNGVQPPDPGGSRSSELLQNRPNPMGPLTTIAYRLAEDGPVSLRIYDTSGRRVTTLRDGRERAGFREVHWNGANREGKPMPSGVYFYRLETPGRSESRKLLLAR